MFNHLRTLLLNRPATQREGPDYPGEELCPAGYSPINVVGPYRTAELVLFGSNPDRCWLNYRLREYLTCIHLSELAPDAVRHDPRLTYWTTGGAAFNYTWRRLGTTTVSYYGDAGSVLDVLGSPVAAEAAGRMLYRYRLEIENGGRYTVSDLSPGLVFPQTSGEYPVADGRGGPVALGSSGVSVSFAPAAGDVWEFESLARPATGIETVAARLIEALGPDGGGLFPDAEPYSRWGGVWRYRGEPVYKVAAACLAVAESRHERGGF